MAGAAAKLGARQAELIAQDVDQQASFEFTRLDVCSVDVELHGRSPRRLSDDAPVSISFGRRGVETRYKLYHQALIRQHKTRRFGAFVSR
jgi:hypothetical protein